MPTDEPTKGAVEAANRIVPQPPPPLTPWVAGQVDLERERAANLIDRLAVAPAVAERDREIGELRSRLAEVEAERDAALADAARLRDEIERECIAEICRICASGGVWPRRLSNWGPKRDRVCWDHFKGKKPNSACFAGAIWERRYQRAALAATEGGGE